MLPLILSTSLCASAYGIIGGGFQDPDNRGRTYSVCQRLSALGYSNKGLFSDQYQFFDLLTWSSFSPLGASVFRCFSTYAVS
jgi:hypothetical protein